MQIPTPAHKRFITHRIKKHDVMLITLLVPGSASHHSLAASEGNRLEGQLLIL